MELILARHAATPLNEARRFQGWIDPALSAAGEAQARRLADALAGGGSPRSVFASDLRRAWRTAELAAPGVPVVREPRLRELAFGSFEGATWEENASRHRDAFAAWARDPERCPPPGGEAVGQLRRRVLPWLEELPAEGPVLVVSHGGPLRVLLARCLALAPRWEVERGLTLAPGAVARVRWEAP